jgi:uncharacterized lipoprotein
MNKLLLSTVALLALAGCSNSGGSGDKASEVTAKPEDAKPAAGAPAQPPAGVNAPAAQDPNGFAEAMKKQAQQGVPK